MKEKRKLSAETKKQLRAIALVFILINSVLWLLLTYFASRYLESKWIVLMSTIGAITALLMVRLSSHKRIVTITLNVLMTICLVLVNCAMYKLSSVTDPITEVKTVYTVKVVALSTSSMNSEDNFLGVKIGVKAGEDYYTTWAENILTENERVGYVKSEYATYSEMWEALTNGEIDICVMSSIAEADLNELFATDEEEYDVIQECKVLFEDKQEEVMKELEGVDISSQGFTILITGVDLSGNDINKNARADINILVTVNPSTGRINIQVLPRDLWVELPSNDYKMTKLNRACDQAGCLGSIEAIEHYFDNKITINYYAKINFKGFVNLVDAVGGIEVYSQYTYTHGKYRYVKGMNKMDGEKALDFCRARKMLPENDVSRGKNQMRVIVAILEKFMQNPSIDKMNKILNAIKGNFVTSFSEKDLVTLFNMLMTMKDKMVIDTNSMKGDTNHWATDPIYGGYLYYFVPVEGEKEAALQRILDTLNGVELVKE